MITPFDALQLPNARPSKSDIEDCRAVVAKLNQHINKHMTFGGPTPLEVSFSELSKTGAQLLCCAMKRIKWTVNANLIAEAPRFAGGQPVPHHWVLQLQPTPDVYDELLADMSFEPVSDA